MVSRHSVENVCISVEVADVLNLYIMLERSGGINRLGPYNPDDRQKPHLSIGVIEQSVFQTFIELVPDAIFDLLDPDQPKGYAIPGHHIGQPCVVQMTFTDNERPSTIAFSYGAKSAGPPADVCDCIQRVVDLTDIWYEKSQEVTEKESLPPSISN